MTAFFQSLPLRNKNEKAQTKCPPLLRDKGKGKGAESMDMKYA